MGCWPPSPLQVPLQTKMRACQSLLLAALAGSAILASECSLPHLEHTSLSQPINGERRDLISEAGDLTHNSTAYQSHGVIYGVVDDYPWGSPEITYPTNGSAWGAHITGPSDKGDYIITWFTRGAVVGNPSGNTAFDPTQAATRCPEATFLFLSTDPNSLINTNNKVTGVPAFTYSRIPKDSQYASYSYASPCIRHAVLSGLKPDTHYYYALPADGAGATAKLGTFETLPTKDVTHYPLTLGLVGDLGQTRNSSETAANIKAQMKPSDIDILLIAGDISYADDYKISSPDRDEGPDAPNCNQQRWDSAAYLMEDLFGNILTLTCIGNHEIEDNGINGWRNTTTHSGFAYPTNYPFQAYAARYPVPGVTSQFGSIDQNLYYSTVLGGVVKLIVMNNYVPFYPGSVQYVWAMNQFQSTDRSVTPWLVVMFHASIYHSYRSHYKEANCFLSVWEDVFYKYGVDFTIAGHVHAYERTHPVYKHTVDPCAPVHITIGDGGNVEGLSRNFVDDIISGTTGTTYCDSFNSNSKLNNPPSDYRWSSGDLAQVQLDNCTTYTYEYPYSVGGGSTLVPYALSQHGRGFCQSSQPLWSAFRDPTFGFGVLTMTSDTVAQLKWYANVGGVATLSDSVQLQRQDKCTPAHRRRNLIQYKAAGQGTQT